MEGWISGDLLHFEVQPDALIVNYLFCKQRRTSLTKWIPKFLDDPNFQECLIINNYIRQKKMIGVIVSVAKLRISKIIAASTFDKKTLKEQLLLGGGLLICLWLVVIRHLGVDLSKMPGSFGDPEFNMYVLEHGYRWLQGIDPSFWDAPIFFPAPRTIAFSDALIGSLPVFAAYRLIGFSRETAFQWWYISGFVLNYAAACFVLKRLGLKSVAVMVGAFFFTFGLPILAQDNHPQLLYRIGVPLVSFYLWKFYRNPTLYSLLLIVFWFVWQFYLTIYIGVFLIFLFIVMSGLLAVTSHQGSITSILMYWPRKGRDAWLAANTKERWIAITGFCVLILLCINPLQPYFWVSVTYGFSRSWEVVASMLPRIQSYFLADNSQLWKSDSTLFNTLPVREGHQLFPGVSVFMLVLIGIVWRIKNENHRYVYLNLWAIFIMILATLYINDTSFYKLIFSLPLVNSIRAVARIILVIMWPLAMFISYVIDQLVRSTNNKFNLNFVAYLFLVFMIVESALYNPYTHSKVAVIARLEKVKSSLPNFVVHNPILFIAADGNDVWGNEIDGILLSQDLNWPTLNGYSGNFPNGFGPATTCGQLVTRLKSFIQYTDANSEADYESALDRVVPIGFNDCDQLIQNYPSGN